MSSAHHVLWTGGWDSTFRVCELLLEHRREVQPHYVIDRGRDSTPVELERLRLLRGALIGLDPSVEPLLATPHILHLEDITAVDSITRSFIRMARAHPGLSGSQNEWLARWAAHLGLTGVERCLVRDDPFSHAVLEEITRHSGRGGADSLWELDPEHAGADLRALYGRFTYPTLHKTKAELWQRSVRGGYSDLLTLTWTCFRPTLRGQPCGVCTPCTNLAETALGSRSYARPPSPLAVIRGRANVHPLTRAGRTVARRIRTRPRLIPRETDGRA